MQNTLVPGRAEHGGSQAQLAERLGVSGPTFVSIERGRFDPSLPLAFHIARVFYCAIEDVFTPGAME